MYLPGSSFSSRTMLYEDCAALAAAEDPGARSLVGRSAALGLDQALRAHVGPVLLDVIQAGRSGVGVVHDVPAMRRGLGCRPQAVLTLVVHKHPVGSVWVLEGIRHSDPHFAGDARQTRRSGRPSAPSTLRTNRFERWPRRVHEARATGKM